MEYYSVTTPAASDPVLLADAKAFMRWTSTSEDSLITALISTATQRIEEYTGQCFVTRTITGEFSNLYATRTEVYPWIKLRRAPLSSITSVQVSIDSVFTDAEYQIKKHTHGFSRLLFPNFLYALDDVPYPLKVVFVAGYTAVPELIKTAIKEYVNFLFRHRGDCIDASACASLSDNHGMPAIVKNMISSYKIVEVYA